MDVVKRYVVLETLKVFLVTIGITLLLMTLGGGAKEGLRRGLPLPLVLQTMPYIVPEMLRFVVPGCLLFAVCSVFGRMSAANEVIAIKSMGINPLKIVWPVLILAYVLSLFTFWLYDVCALWSRPGIRQLVVESVDRIAYSVLQSNGAFTSKGMSIIVKGVEGDRLLQPVIRLESKGDQPAITLTAKEAKLRTDKDSGTLRFECRDGEISIDGEGRFLFPDRFEHEIVLDEMPENPENHMSPATLGSRMIHVQVRREQDLLAELEQELAMLRPLEDEQRQSITSEMERRRSRLYRLQAEVPRRISNGFGCLCFALIGVPIAMWRRSSDTMSVFFMCFLPILLVYYPLLVTGENIARDGVLPQYSVWLANVVLVIAAVFVLRRVLRR